MMLSLYTVRDIYGVSYDQSVITAPTDGAAARLFVTGKGININELTLFRVGTYNPDTGVVSGIHAPEAVSWSVYRKPEVQMSPMTEDQFDATKEKLS